MGKESVIKLMGRSEVYLYNDLYNKAAYKTLILHCRHHANLI